MDKDNKSGCKYIAEEEKKINYEKEEFESMLRRKEGYFKNHLDKYLDYYNLSKDEMKHFGESGRYNIPFLTAPLIKIMLENITENPFKDGRLAKVEDRNMKKERQKNYNGEQKKKEKKMYLLDGKGINLDKIIKYNEVIINQIENLPVDARANLKKNTTYEFNYVLNEVIPIILDRVAVLFSLLISQSSVSAGNIYIEIINSLDSWIRNIAIHSADMDEYKKNLRNLEFKDNKDLINPIFLNIGNDGQLNYEVEKSYIIDSILRDEYYRSIELTKKLNDQIKKKGLNELLKCVGYMENTDSIDKDKIERYRVLEWIGDSKETYKHTKYELNLSEERLNNFKSRVKSLDKVTNGKMFRVNFYKEILKSILKSVSRDNKKYRNIMVGDAAGFIEPRELGLIFYKYLEKLLRLKSYEDVIKAGTFDIDNKFSKDIEMYAIKIWEEYDCKDKKREKQVENYINLYYEKLKDKDTETSNIRVHLTKAIEEMIIPKLIDEINNLV